MKKKKAAKEAPLFSIPNASSGGNNAVRPTSTKKPAPASQLRAQTRKLLGKHYRAKHGVR